MLLSDLDILDRLAREDESRIVITPLVSSRQLQPSSVDIRLGTHFKTVRNVGISALDPQGKSPANLRLQTETYTHDVKLALTEPFFIHPGEFALGTSLEYVVLPTDLSASLEGRSSFGRLGITIHSTAGFIDPGFAGRVTFEIQNEGTQPVALYPGMRVAQLCFVQLSSPALVSYGSGLKSKYKQQLTTTNSRWYDDEELPYLVGDR